MMMSMSSCFGMCLGNLFEIKKICIGFNEAKELRRMNKLKPLYVVSSPPCSYPSNGYDVYLAIA